MKVTEAKSTISLETFGVNPKGLLIRMCCGRKKQRLFWGISNKKLMRGKKMPFRR